MPPQFVFTTENLTKFYNDKPVFQDISLCFYYGVKIGIVGENGSGKTTLLRIMAGIDNEFMGTAQLGKKMRVGYLPLMPLR